MPPRLLTEREAAPRDRGFVRAVTIGQRLPAPSRSDLQCRKAHPQPRRCGDAKDAVWAAGATAQSKLPSGNAWPRAASAPGCLLPERG